MCKFKGKQTLALDLVCNRKQAAQAHICSLHKGLLNDGDTSLKVNVNVII